MPYYSSKPREKDSQMIETQIFENPNFKRRDRKSRSKSRHHHPEMPKLESHYPKNINPLSQPTSNWHHQLDMMSLSKQQNLETPFHLDDSRNGVDKTIFNNPFINDNKSSHLVDPINKSSDSSHNPFSLQNGPKGNQSGHNNSPFLGPRNHASSSNCLPKSPMWNKDLSKMDPGSQPSSIELLAQDLENDECSSSESIDTNSFSSYIPGPSLDQGTFAAFTELVEQEYEHERGKMVPLMKQTSSHGLVLASRESPKVR